MDRTQGPEDQVLRDLRSAVAKHRWPIRLPFYTNTNKHTGKLIQNQVSSGKDK